MEHLFCVGAYCNLKFAPILPPVKQNLEKSRGVIVATALPGHRGRRPLQIGTVNKNGAARGRPIVINSCCFSVQNSFWGGSRRGIWRARGGRYRQTRSCGTARPAHARAQRPYRPQCWRREPCSALHDLFRWRQPS